MTDAEFRMMSTARKISSTSTDAEVDEQADKLESFLSAIRVARRSWVREMLFSLRSVELEGPWPAMFADSVAAANEAGVLGEKASLALKRLADSRRRSIA